MIDVNPNHLETITGILAAHVPECEVRAFGSRVTWTSKDYSDLDLAVVGGRALDPDALRRMKEAFETSNLPFRVDVLDWHAISAAFRKVIEKEYEVVQKGKRQSLGRAPYVSLTSQRGLSVALPPIDVQRAIARILGTLDDKIELNRRMNETLEAMARALFKSWFVHLDSARVPVNDLIVDGAMEIGDGYRAKSSELGAPGLPFVRAGDLKNGIDTRGADTLLLESVSHAGNKISRPGDVAFPSKGTVGRFARVNEHTERFVYSPQVCYWRSLDVARVHPVILYCWMQSDDLLAQIAAVAGQTDMAPYVSLRDQRRMEMPVFPNEQREVARTIEPLLQRQAVAEKESKTLATLRDTLLPKLISGELRVKDWERMGAAVL